MNNKQKPTIENIKKEAKDYYKGKNMLPRYIFVGFLLIIIALQFFLPRHNTDIDLVEDNHSSNTIDSGNIDILEFSFLDIKLDLNSQDLSFQMNLDYAISDIISNNFKLSFIYKNSLLFFPSLEHELQIEGIPTDFKYLILLNDLNEPVRTLNNEIQEKYSLKVNEYVDENMNYEIAKNASIEYIKYLYKDFQDRNLVLLAYFMGSNELKSMMMDQNQKDFNDLYIPSDAMSKYFKIMGYKYVFDNISNYINIKDFIPYISPKTTIVKLGETKDIIKWANKEGYTFKEIKELNPRILGNSLPKGKWTINLYKN